MLKIIKFSGQRPKSNSKVLFESDAQKQRVQFGFGHRFRNLNYFEVGIFFHIP
jgi:hypothetical protein